MLFLMLVAILMLKSIIQGYLQKLKQCVDSKEAGVFPSHQPSKFTILQTIIP